MDLEHLNRSQMVMLTLLVSFMTSTATGIVTVALMQEAPLAITETVNRVVERTVEKVVPGQAASAATPVTQTVVVKESDVIAQAVDMTAPSIVRIYTNEASSSTFLALGIVLDSHGTIATDAEALGENKVFLIELAGSQRVAASVQTEDKLLGVMYLSATTSTAQKTPTSWKPFSIAAKHGVIGQTTVVVAGKSVARIAQGIITAFTPLSEGKDSVDLIETSLNKDSILAGSPIIDSDGMIIGLSTHVSRVESESAFIPTTALHLPQTAATDTAQ